VTLDAGAASLHVRIDLIVFGVTPLLGNMPEFGEGLQLQERTNYGVLSMSATSR